ncbi:hypothetical protein BDZ94DRAFT_1241156 [Collybia nuda]|uniref:RRM domain-containing protein n=1 Tax=Collybia nuda TaxID=64659 RepID=A0A9P6CDC8_9AGAR|nr:hypothetical protein BDZ94DRAFT_1241156 [Collybia nuda]
MTSLLERMSIPGNSSAGPIRSKTNQSSSARSTGPYNRTPRIPKGDVDSPWTHDLYESGSLSARITDKPTAPRVNFTTITQKAFRDATASVNPGQLSIKGASAASQGNVVEVSGLVDGTTAEDVAAIFKRCGEITNFKSLSHDSDVRIRLAFKSPTSASAAVQKFNNQPADGKVLSVRVVGSATAGITLGGRLGGTDGLGLVREEGSVDVLIDIDNDNRSKMRSDSLIHADPRAQILLAPPGANPADYIQTPEVIRTGNPRRGPIGRGRGGRRGRRGGHGGEARMETD